MRLRVRSPMALILVVGLILSACASTAIGRAVQSAEGAKIAVESAADEVIRMHLRKELADADYLKAKAAYDTWAHAQQVYVEALVGWSKTKDAAADAKVQAALTQLGPTLTAAADTLCGFASKSPNLAAVCAKIGRG